MSGIVYRIFYPGIVAALLCGLFLMLTKYSSRKMKNDKKKVAKYEMVFFAVLGLLGLGLSVYYSLDLILRDFSRFTGKCVFDGSENKSLNSVQFVSAEVSVTLGVSSEDKQEMIAGETYTVTFGKRTKMLTEFEK